MGLVDVLVANPQERSFSPQSECIVSEFQTLRSTLVDSVINLLFPTTGEHRPLLFFRAPPLSGKSSLCDLLCDCLAKTKPEVLVARVLATRKPSSVSFSEYFKSVFNCELDKFWDLTCDRVLLIDDAHLTYDDENLWLGLLKNTYERRLRGPRIVLFSSSGGDRQVRIEKDFTIDRRDTFGLSRSDTKLGLQLSRLELDEMIGGRIFAQVGDLIWHLSSAHIGIAHGILSFLTEEFQNKAPESIKASEMELVLRSTSLLDYIHKEIRGIPTAQSYELLFQQQNISSRSRQEIMSLMYRMEMGEVILSPKEALDSDVVAAIEWLKRSEFLYEDDNTQLQFASNMHLKMWLYSIRDEPYPRIEDFARDDYFVKCIKRMNASKLHGYTTANTCKATQEYQIQLYLYRCTVGALPQDVLVTPERRMDDGTGFNDLVIRGSSFFWIWELVVNEDDEVDISSRFETRGKGFEGYTGSFQYVLVDFRQNKRGRHEKDGCLYVSFDESYEKALISGLGGAVMTVDLYK